MREFSISRMLWLVLILPLILAGCGSSEEIEAGSTAPNFTLPDALGNEVALSDFSGQPVLLFFHMAVG